MVRVKPKQSVKRFHDKTLKKKYHPEAIKNCDVLIVAINQAGGILLVRNAVNHYTKLIVRQNPKAASVMSLMNRLGPNQNRRYR